MIENLESSFIKIIYISLILRDSKEFMVKVSHDFLQCCITCYDYILCREYLKYKIQRNYLFRIILLVSVKKTVTFILVHSYYTNLLKLIEI